MNMIGYPIYTAKRTIAFSQAARAPDGAASIMS